MHIVHSDYDSAGSLHQLPIHRIHTPDLPRPSPPVTYLVGRRARMRAMHSRLPVSAARCSGVFPAYGFMHRHSEREGLGGTDR